MSYERKQIRDALRYVVKTRPNLTVINNINTVNVKKQPDLEHTFDIMDSGLNYKLDNGNTMSSWDFISSHDKTGAPKYFLIKNENNTGKVNYI